MSKRNSIPSSPASNTLFKYFAKSPSTMPSPKDNSKQTQAKDSPKTISVKIPNEKSEKYLTISQIEITMTLYLCFQ